MADVLLWLLLVEIIGLAVLPTTYLFFRWLPDRGYALAKALGLLLLGYLAWLAGMIGIAPFAAPTLWVILAVLVAGNVAILAFHRPLDIGNRGQETPQTTPVTAAAASEIDEGVSPDNHATKATPTPDTEDTAIPSTVTVATEDMSSSMPANFANGAVEDKPAGRFALLAEMQSFYNRRKVYVFVLEAVFILALLAMANLRSFNPDIRSTEKFMDMAFINSMLSSMQMPPADPWYSGLSINYYYFGHLLAAALTRMTGVLPGVAFNLDLSLIFGLVATMLCGLAYNLVALAQGKLRHNTVPVVSRTGLLAGVLAATFVLVLGNLDAARQIVQGVSNAATTGASFNFSWWDPSRVLYDCLPNVASGGCTYTATINEFPAFSFLLSDLHPHVMSMPFVLLAIGLALNLLLIPANMRRPFAGSIPSAVAQLGLAALILGVLFMLNTWDYPTFVVLALVAYGLNRRRAAAFVHDLRWARETGLYALVAVGLIALSLIAFLPFHLTFKAQLSDHYLPEAIANVPILHTIASSIGISPTQSPLMSYWTIFGLFSAPLLAFWAIKLWPYLRDPYGYRYPAYSWGYMQKPVSDDDLDAEINAGPSRVLLVYGAVLSVVGLGIFVPAALGFYNRGDGSLGVLIGVAGGIVFAAGVGYFAAYGLDWLRPSQPAAEIRLLTVLMAVVLVILSFSFLHFELFGPFYIILVTVGLMLWSENRPDDGVRDTEVALSDEAGVGDVRLADSFALAAILLMVLIDLGIEVVFLRDTFDTRMNSIFKFYFQSWIVFGLMSGYGLWRVYVTAWTGRVTVEDISAAPSAALSLARSNFPTIAPNPATIDPLLFSKDVSLEEMAGGRGESYDYHIARRVALAVNATSSTLPPITAYTGSADASAGLGNEDVADSTQAVWQQPALAEVDTPKPPRKLWWRWGWAFAVALLILVGLAYPYFGIWDKTNQWNQRYGLDGETWLGRSSYAADYPAIVWLRNHTQDNPAAQGVLLEAVNNDYGDYNMVSTYTGLTSVMGWPGHEFQWRAGDKNVMDPKLIDKRVADIKTIYSTTDVYEAKRLLSQYKVRYVYVGTIETGLSAASVYDQSYHENYGAGLSKFASFMRPVYSANGVTIYAWNPTSQQPAS